ncbi:MAG: hypothetical protein ACRELZ_07790 [Candidatus Rokuibacteriota bacterium]
MAEVGVEQRGDSLARREVDEDGPVHGISSAGDELTLGRRVESGARGQQQQSDFRARSRRRARVYDVVLARVDFPIVIRWLAEHVALLTRQHVVVSAPKMLLGSSIGFS